MPNNISNPPPASPAGRRSRIYTRTGDTGAAAVMGGHRLPKTNSVFVVMGDIDELSAHLGLLKALLRPDCRPVPPPSVALLDEVQRQLFAVSASLCGGQPYTNAACSAFVARLEREIDALDGTLGGAIGFVTPGADVPSAQAHVARTVCRRAERSLVAHAPASPALPFLNRLSDYLFVLALALTPRGA